MNATSVTTEDVALVSVVATMPRLSRSRESAVRLASGGPIDAAFIGCASLEASSLLIAQEQIDQIVDARGAWWIQLIEPPEDWFGRCGRRWSGEAN